jgi:penicillin V acylase-like amidase (Ntn superfamily)
MLWNTNKLAVLSGRTMDWPTSTEPHLAVFPRGRDRHGGLLGSETIIAENALDWTSAYGSLVTTTYGLGSMDGINERGLAAHALYFAATELGERDPGKPGLLISLCPQYLLDNATTVTEALALLTDVQLVMAEARGYNATIHFAIEDADGDSAIVEYLGGERIVHHGREHTLMTNDPSYEEQMSLLQEQDFSHPSREMPLPGNVNPRDRFQRAAYYSALLPEPSNAREAVAGVLSIARNVSVPFGAPYGEFGIYNTEYRTVCDLTNRRYFFELTTSPNVIWTELDRFDLSAGGPVMMLDPDDIELSGDVSDRYQPGSANF